MKQNKAGGKRKGAGRKKGEPTKAIGKRVPVRFHKQLVKMIEEELQHLLSLKNQTDSFRPTSGIEAGGEIANVKPVTEVQY